MTDKRLLTVAVDVLNQMASGWWYDITAATQKLGEWRDVPVETE